MTLNLGLISFFKAIFFVTCFSSFCFGVNASAQTVEEAYKSFCQSCHGDKLTGGAGPSLVDSTWLHGKSVSNVFRIIKNGVPKGGMPAFSKTLTDGQIYGLVGYIREQGLAAQEHQHNWELVDKKAKPQALNAAGHAFTVNAVTRVSGELWSMVFLPKGEILATIKEGGLWLIEGAKSVKVTQGLPKPMTGGQGGYFDIKLDPDYSKNAYIYLSYSEQSAKGSMTRVDRGKLKKVGQSYEWEHSKVMFSAPVSDHIDSHYHFGGRITFKDNSMFITVGDRGRRPMAQDTSVPNGKIHHLSMDGTPATDNPFLSDKSVFASIWSFGHRNPQGMSVHPLTGDLWVAEHGPRGGDEINIIQKGKNYGWPVITYGMNYDGTPMTDKTHQESMEQPKHYWVPSIAVSGIEFYTGSKFPQWKNHMLVASLGKQELHLLKIEGDKVIADELLLKGLGRLRHVADGPDGYPYITALSKDGKSTVIYQLVPR